MIDFKNMDLMDSLDLAISIEEEARERYQTFAELVGKRYQGDASDFFETMASNEEQHRNQLSARRRKIFGDTPRKIDLSDCWDLAETPAASAARTFMSAKQAMEMALAAETKARLFFEEALLQISQPDVRSLFSELAAEEIKHQCALQRRLDLLPKGDTGPDLSEEDLDEPPAL
ncbi:MAG: ferritin family protein [Bdellovibrionota bacterium]